MALTGSFSPHALALDFGGTKLAAAVVDTACGQTLSHKRCTTPAGRGAHAGIQTMFDLGRQALQAAGVSQPARIGISFGGPVSADRRQVLDSHHVAGWSGIPLPQLASEAFGCPASMDNDANAAALGAWAFDANREPHNLVYIQVSTGVGAGLILDGHLYRGRSLAGELGHITLQPGGPGCTCGKRGCLESLCSGWAIARDGRKSLAEAKPGSPLARLRIRTEDLDARLVLQAARDGDPLAAQVSERAFTALGLAVANLISLLDPDLLILGGGVMRAEDIVGPILISTLERELSPMFRDRYSLRFSSLDGNETLLGAALLD